VKEGDVAMLESPSLSTNKVIYSIRAVGRGTGQR
jgi:hypothetical protein